MLTAIVFCFAGFAHGADFEIGPPHAPVARIDLVSPARAKKYLKLTLTVTNPSQNSLTFRWHYSWGRGSMYFEAVPLAGGQALYSRWSTPCIDPTLVGVGFFCRWFHVMPANASESVDVTLTLLEPRSDVGADSDVTIVDTLDDIIIGPQQAGIEFPSEGKYRLRWVYQNSPGEDERWCGDFEAPVWHGRLESNWLDILVGPEP